MYKIVKEIHTYKQGGIKFRIHERFLLKWIPSEIFSEYETYELAEEAIIKKLNRKHGGIVKLNKDVYKFYPYSLSLP